MPRAGAKWLALLAFVAVLAAFPSERRAFLSGAGLAQGALIAAIALGAVLTYRGSGVVNFANSAIAAYSAYTYASLRVDGALFLPPLPNPLIAVQWIVGRERFDAPDLPTTISLGQALPFVPGLLLAVGVAGLLGLALHAAVFRPLRAAPPLAKTVASIGVFLLLQAIIVRRFSSSPRPVPPLPGNTGRAVDLRLLTLSLGQLVVVGVVVVCASALAVVYRTTRFGLATRAAAENETAAVVLGYSPDRLAAVNWVCSTMLTGLLGILVASVSSNIDPVVVTALIVPALTAALVGRFTSFGVTTAAAFLLGMQLPLLQYWSVAARWFPRVGGLPVPGLETVVPLVVIVGVLSLRGARLPGRGATQTGGAMLPLAPSPGRWSLAVGGPLLFAAVAVAAVTLPPALRMGLTTSLVGATMCLSVVVITGLVGQISLAPMTLAGVSAFVVADLSTDRGWPFPFPLVVGAVVAAGVGALIALPALRIRGVSLAIVTLAAAVAADRFLFENSLVNGGLRGAPVRTPALIAQADVTVRHVGPLTIGDGRQPNPLLTLTCLVVAAGACYLVAAVRRAPLGARLLAVRADERAAASVGVDVALVKVGAFALSSSIAGVGGAIMAYRSGAAHAESFTFLQSLALFAVAYLGGITRISGALVGGLLVSGGLLFTALSEYAGVPGEFNLMLGGLGLVVTAVAHPDGVAADVVKLAAAVRRRGPRSVQAGPAVQGLVQ